jgi:hypothetical protein
MQLVLAGPVLVAPSTPGEKVEDPPVNFSKSSMWGMRAHRWNTAFHSPRDPRVAWSFDKNIALRIFRDNAAASCFESAFCRSISWAKAGRFFQLHISAVQ